MGRESEGQEEVRGKEGEWKGREEEWREEEREKGKE